MVSREQVIEKIRQIYSEVLETEIDINVFSEGTDLINKLHIDSLIALQIIVKIEKDFNVLIEDDNIAIELLDNIDKTVRYINIYQKSE